MLNELTVDDRLRDHDEVLARLTHRVAALEEKMGADNFGLSEMTDDALAKCYLDAVNRRDFSYPETPEHEDAISRYGREIGIRAGKSKRIYKAMRKAK